MTSQLRGILIGLVAGLAIAWLTGGTHLDAFLRVTGGGQYLLDTRVDESTLGRIINIPAASLGDVSLQKRSWIFASMYVFTLQLRPEIAAARGPRKFALANFWGGEPGRAISGLAVNVRLPGRLVATNATRVTAGTAAWDALPRDGLYLRTLVVQWAAVIILVAALAIGVGARRR